MGDKTLRDLWKNEKLVRGRRPCPQCGEIRTVNAFVDKRTGEDVYDPPLCGVCDALDRANRHERAAQRFRAKAQRLLVRRERSKAKREAKK